MFLRWVQFILITTFSATLALGAELNEFGVGLRALGMGGVRVPGQNSASDFMWNPAHLSKISGIQWQIIDLAGGINGLQAYNDFKDVQIDGLDSMSGLYGKRLWGGFSGYSALAFPYFGMAVYDRALLEMELHNPAFPYLDATVQNDYGFILGFSGSLTPLWNLGVNVKRMTRFGGPQVIGTEVLNTGSLSSSTLQDQFQNEGVGYGMDLGTTFKVPGGQMTPEIGLFWQDVGDTAFQKTKGASAPERIRNNLSLGITSAADFAGFGYATGIEYRHINDANEQLGKKIHMGLELSLLLIDIRAGFSQGYTTYGAGLDLLIGELDVAWYKTERGAYPGQKPDERIQIGFNMNIGFDPSLKMLELGSKKRKLKQRR